MLLKKIEKAIVLCAVYGVAIVGVFMLQLRTTKPSDAVVAIKNMAKDVAPAKVASKEADAGDVAPASPIVAESDAQSEVAQVDTATSKDIATPTEDATAKTDDSVAKTDDTTPISPFSQASSPDDDTSQKRRNPIIVFFERLMSAPASMKNTAVKVKDKIKPSEKQVSTAPIDIINGTTEPLPFEYKDVLSLSKSIQEDYDKTITTFNADIVAAFSDLLQNQEAITDEAVMAYVATNSTSQKYNEAINSVPASFKNSSSRSFHTTPYFGRLAATAPSVIAATKNYDASIANATSKTVFDFINNIEATDYLCVMHKTAAAQKFAKTLTSIDLSSLTVSQKAAIIGSLSRVNKIINQNQFTTNNSQDEEKQNSTTSPNSADTFSDSIATFAKDCVASFKDNCSILENILSIKDGDTDVSPVDAIKAGAALVSYGDIVADTDVKAMGQYLVQCYYKKLDRSPSALFALYPFLIDNPYYPHFVLLDDTAENPVWVYTCSPTVKSEHHTQANGRDAVTLSITLQEQSSHYLIFGNVKSFRQIFIYDIAYRSDPNFERYNSSGYVYQANNKLFLLKSRHRKAIETIRLVY